MSAPLEGFTPHPPEFAQAYRAKGLWAGRTLGEHLDAWVARYAERVALIAGEERVTYSELGARVASVARSLEALGIQPRDRVVMQLHNVPQFFYVTFALFKLGALPVMALPAHRETEIRYLVEFSEAVAWCGPANFRGFDYVAMMRSIAPGAPRLKHLLVAGGEAPAGCVSIDAMLGRGDASWKAQHRSDPSDVAFFLLSGGTTGLPKLIPRTHDDYAYNFEVAAELSGLGPESVYLVALPVSHNFPFGTPGALGTFARGGRVVMTLSPSPDVAFPAIERERITITAQVPAVTITWIDSPLLKKHRLSSLAVLQVGGSRLAAEVAQRVKPALGATVQQVFGMAEGLINYTRLDDPDEVLFHTQGRPISPEDEIRIVTWEGKPARPGELGELETRGPYTIRGYYNAPDHNAKAFTADGFYRTGDLVRQHPSGNLVVEGRVKDLINRGGEKISAEEIENLILSHAAVQNVAAVAMPDPVMGERICAYVILRAGETLELDELRAFLEQGKIAPFKLPERLERVEKFPVTSVGKISKKDLREDIAAKLLAEGKTDA